MKVVTALIVGCAVASVLLQPAAGQTLAGQMVVGQTLVAITRQKATAGPTEAVPLKRPVHRHVVDTIAPPACRYRDQPALVSHDAGRTATVLDLRFALPAGYAPDDLVDVSRAGLNGSVQVRSVALPDLREMVRAGRAAGVQLAVQSAYRSYALQVATFAGWVARAGRAEALRFSARPGHSEHQLGTAIDFRSAGGPEPWNHDWARTPEGAWLAANAWRYGWVMSYPRGARAKSCYGYEPWHYRYVGRALAGEIHASGLTPRVYLWRLAAEAT